MRTEFNPFSEMVKEKASTQHGLILYKHKLYFTHRKTEHYFRKFQGFGISVSEVEIAVHEGCERIRIKYHGIKKNKIFEIPIEYLKFLQRYNFEGDEQIIIPEKEMKLIGEEEVSEEDQMKGYTDYWDGYSKLN